MIRTKEEFISKIFKMTKDKPSTIYYSYWLGGTYVYPSLGMGFNSTDYSVEYITAFVNNVIPKEATSYEIRGYSEQVKCKKKNMFFDSGTGKKQKTTKKTECIAKCYPVIKTTWYKKFLNMFRELF